LASTGSSAPLVPWSLLGVPAVTLNGGVGARALPLGVQFVGGAHDDLRLLEVASWCEAVLGPLGEPPLATGLPTAQPPRPDPATC
ncbi:MAG TPA: hypothetical protein VHA75_05775, partial [Rugosimonospora sp.]|nr:hypothetical protein [Rugosimonospora sp.]